MSRQPFSERFSSAFIVIVSRPFVLPLGLISIAFFLLYTMTLYLLVWESGPPWGNDILFVHSDSPIWHEYMIAEVLR
jgi:hypothetical protein